MAFNALDFAKRHPVEIGAGVFAVGVLFLLLRGGSSTSAQPQSSVAGVYGAELAASQQNAQINAQLQAEQTRVNGQIGLSAQQGANDIALAQIQTQSNNYLGQLQTQAVELQNFYGAQTQQASIAANEAVSANQTAAQVAIAAQAAQASIDQNAANNYTNQLQAQYNAQTLMALSANQSNVAIHQTDAVASIAKTRSNNSLFGGIAGAVINGLGAL